MRQHGRRPKFSPLLDLIGINLGNSLGIMHIVILLHNRNKLIKIIIHKLGAGDPYALRNSYPALEPVVAAFIFPAS